MRESTGHQRGWRCGHVSNPQSNGACQQQRPSSAPAIVPWWGCVGDAGFIERNKGCDHLQRGDQSLRWTRGEGHLTGDLFRLHRLRQRRMLMAVGLIIVIFMIVTRHDRIVIVAGDAVRPVTVILRGDLHLTTAVADIPAHHAKHLRPTQREKRESGQQSGRTTSHGAQVTAGPDSSTGNSARWQHPFQELRQAGCVRKGVGGFDVVGVFTLDADGHGHTRVDAHFDVAVGVTHEQAVHFPDHDLEFWGHAHIDYSNMVPLRTPRPRSSRWQICLAHGHYEEDGVPPLRPSWLISDAEIDATGADYLALGHWNRAVQVGTGQVPAFYSGSPDLAKTVNVVRLSGNGTVKVTREPVSW